MKNRLTAVSISCVLVFIVLFSLSDAYSQNLFTDMTEVKREISDLQNQLSELKSVVYGLRRAIMDSAIAQPQKTVEKEPPKDGKVAKQDKVWDEKQLTSVICPAVGKFFSKAEAILRANDPGSAEARMNEAWQELNSALRGYSETHRVSKILNIYEGLSWDTYVAVKLRSSVAGNQDFIEKLRSHKQKFLETCPRD